MTIWNTKRPCGIHILRPFGIPSSCSFGIVFPFWYAWTYQRKIWQSCIRVTLQSLPTNCATEVYVMIDLQNVDCKFVEFVKNAYPNLCYPFCNKDKFDILAVDILKVNIET
jgi:hypothetical protein